MHTRISYVNFYMYLSKVALSEKKYVYFFSFELIIEAQTSKRTDYNKTILTIKNLIKLSIILAKKSCF